MTQCSIRLFQMDAVVGDFSGNLQKLARAAEKAQADGIAILIAPELAVTGYPPEDLLLRPARSKSWKLPRRNCVKSAKD